MKRIPMIGYISLVVLLGSLEICAYILHGPFSIIASRFWVGLSVVFFGIMLFYVAKSFLHAIKHRDIAFFIALVMILAIFGFDLNSHKGITHENTQEIAETILNIETIPDWNYSGVAFLGYPQRQFYIASIPTLLFGSSIQAIKLGFIYPLILGSILFYFALTKLIPTKSKYSSVPALAMLSIFTFPYVVDFGRLYEQAIFPISFTIIACSFAILTIKKPTILHFFGLLWIGSLLGTSYTPSLSSWALLLLFPFVIAFAGEKPKGYLQHGIIFVTDIFIVLMGVLSFLTRTDIAFSIGANNLSINTVATEILQSSILFFGPTEHFFLSPILLVPVLLYILSTISGKNGYLHGIVTLWILGVIASTSYFKGYADPDASLALHRAMVLIPVLLIGMIMAWKSTPIFQNFQKAIFYQYLILVIFSLFILTNLAKTIVLSENLNMVVKDDIQMMLMKKRPIQNILIIAETLDLYSFLAYSNYFFPNLVVTIKPDCPFDDFVEKNTILYLEKGYCDSPQQDLNTKKISDQVLRLTTDSRL